MITPRKKYIAALCLLTTTILIGILWSNRPIFKPALASTSANASAPPLGTYLSLDEAVQSARYNVRASDKLVSASNPAQSLRANFTPEEVQIQSASACQQPWQFRLKLKGYGYGTQLQAVSAGVVTTKANRVEIKRAINKTPNQVIEWYTNSPKGIEQGFTFPARPASDTAANSLRVVMEMQGGWKAKLDANGQAMTLQNNSTSLRYDQLHTFDATGRELASRMELKGTELALVVNDAGAVWPITIDPTLSQQTQFIASNGASSDQLGEAVAISGDTAIVGVPNNDAGVTFNQGAAYVFVRNGSTWSQQAQLVAEDAANNDAFGWSVAISGDTAVIGAYNDDIGSNGDQGSAYVFVRSGSTWSQQGKLTSSNGATNDWFGYSVGVSGDLAVIGAPLNDANFLSNQGSAYIFVRNGSSWSQEAQLNASDAAGNDNYGYAVALSGTTALIGSPAHSVSGNSYQGAAYTFVRSGTSWSQQQQLIASNGLSNDQFGFSVALNGNTAIIGAPQDDVGANSEQGSAYIFVRSDTTWSQQQQLMASNGASADQFGYAVAISNEMTVVGAPNDDVNANPDQGSAYVFTRTGTAWSQQQQLLASNGAAYDNLGWAVAISGYTIVAGAPSDDVGSNTDQGSAYLFSPTCPSITLSPTTLANGTQNLAYTSTSIVPSSGTSPFTYEVSSGTLPSGLTLSASGILSGTPTAAGSYNFTIKITDINLCVGTRAYAMTIASCAPPSVTTQPTNQTALVAGSATFTAAAGGTPPTVQWQVSTDNGNFWTNLNGETTTTLTLSNLTITMSGNKYRAVFTNACGTATSDPATLTVSKLTPTVALNSSSSTTIYGQSVTFTATASGAVAASGIITFKNGATTLGTGTLSGGQASLTTATLNAGNYAITAEYGGDTNYVSNTSSALTQTINQATLTVTADNKTKAYAAANPDLTATITGFVNGDTASVVSGSPALTTTATATSGVGDYPLTAAHGTLAAANYHFTFVSGTLSIATATLTVTADNKARSYGAANPDLTATFSGFVNNETPAVLGGTLQVSTSAQATSAAGTYPIALTGLTSANYTITFVNGTLTVNKALLTVTADHKARVYGAANPDLTATITGFVNGDTSNLISGSAALTTTATAASSASAYPINVAQGTLAAANYDFTFVNGTLTVGKAILTVAADHKNRAYGTVNPVFTNTITGFVNGDTSTVVSGAAALTTSATGNSAAGTYPITVTAGTLSAANYDFTFVPGTLTIGKATLTVIADNKNRVYGMANPAFTTTIIGFVNGEAGNVVTGEAALSTTATASSAVGTYALTATLGTLAASNYDFTFSNGTLTVSKAMLTVTADNKTRTYGTANPTFTATMSGFVNNDSANVVSGEAALSSTATVSTAVGSYAIAAAPGTLAATNYDFTFVNGLLIINQATLTITADSKSRTYGAANPSFTVQFAGFVNNDNESVLTGAPDVTTTATASSAIGSYPITVRQGILSTANYQFVFVDGMLTVGKATLSIIANDATRSYGVANPTLTGTLTGVQNNDNITASYTTAATATTAVGTHAITATLIDPDNKQGNYDVTLANGILTITQATLTITAENKSRSYGVVNPELTATFTGFVNGETQAALGGALQLNTEANAGSATGNYPITVTGLTSSNYAIAFVNGTLTVNKALLTVTADHKARAYGAANPDLTATITGFVNGDTASVVSGSPALTTTATATSGVGDYPLTAAHGTLAAANYHFTFVSGTLSIATATLTVTADNKARSYGAANPDLTATFSGFVNNETPAVLGGTLQVSTSAQATSAAGTYPIALTGLTSANYTITFVNGTLTVNKALLTVTADHKARVYGAANPDLTATITGFVNGDTNNLISGSAALTTTATAASSASAYPINVAQGTLAAANYDFTFVNGTLTVGKAILTVAADHKNRAYGTVNPVFTNTITGFVNGDTSTVVSGAAALTTSATGNSAAGTYPITVTAGTLSAANYDFTFVPGTLTIGKATLTVSAENKSKVFGAALPELTFSYAGFLNGETASVVTGTPSVTTTATASSNAGTYPITLAPGSLAAESYDLIFANGTLTINPANTTLTLVSDAPSALVGQNVIFTAILAAVAPGTGTPTGTITFKNGAATLGTTELTNGQASFSTNQLAIGTHSITASYAGTANFNASAAPAFSQSVGKSAATVTLASSLESVSYGQPFTLTANVSGTGATPSGTVRFMNGSTLLGTAALAGNTASLTLNSLPVATHNFTAIYEGDAQNEGGTSRTFSLTVNKAKPAVNVASSANPAAWKQFITLAVNLNSNLPGVSAPTGSVVFKDGSTVLGTSALDRLGRASISTNQLSGGAHTITAEFNGDGNYEANLSPALALTIGKGITTIRLTSSAKVSTAGQPLSFTAAVYSTGDTPTGLVEFYDATTLLGSATLNGGVAALTTDTLATGERSITAAYKGDEKSATNQSAPLKQTISNLCIWNLSTTSLAVNPQGGFGQITVETPSYCYWYAYTTENWITVTDYGPEVGAASFIVAPLTTGTSRTGTIFVADKRVTIVQTKTTTSVSGASFQGGSIAAHSIVSVFGESMATATESAQAIPLPTTLAQTKVKITDSNGVAHFAPLFYVSPLQINYQIPADVAIGPALVTIQTEAGNNITGGGMIEIGPIAPALFSANSSGKDLAAANIQRVRVDGSQSVEPIAQWDGAQNKIVPIPIDLGEAGEEVYLVLYGTGVRSRIDLISVRATVNDEDTEVLYADTQGYFVGVDQINLKLSRKLAGKGDVDVKILIEGKVANTVRINIK